MQAICVISDRGSSAGGGPSTNDADPLEFAYFVACFDDRHGSERISTTLLLYSQRPLNVSIAFAIRIAIAVSNGLHATHKYSIYATHPPYAHHLLVCLGTYQRHQSGPPTPTFSTTPLLPFPPTHHYKVRRVFQVLRGVCLFVCFGCSGYCPLDVIGIISIAIIISLFIIIYVSVSFTFF